MSVQLALLLVGLVGLVAFRTGNCGCGPSSSSMHATFVNRPSGNHSQYWQSQWHPRARLSASVFQLTDDEFIAAILDDSCDKSSYLVYADWLEERGDARGEFLRIESEFLNAPLDDPRCDALKGRLKVLHQSLDSGWVALVRRVRLDPLDELRAVMPPPKRPSGTTGDWIAVEEALGLTLPADYKAYLKVYGGGNAGGIEVSSPLAVPEKSRDYWEGCAAVYQDLAQYIEIPYPVFPDPGGLLSWGSLGNDLLFWRTIGDPDDWPFIYYDNSEWTFFEIKGLSAVAFILEAITQRSPLLFRLRYELDPPCEFEPHMVEARIVRFVNYHEFDFDALIERLTNHWSADSVQLRRSESGMSLRSEILAGYVSFTTDTGDDRTFSTVCYDEAYATAVEEGIGELLAAGFERID